MSPPFYHQSCCACLRRGKPMHFAMLMLASGISYTILIHVSRGDARTAPSCAKGLLHGTGHLTAWQGNGANNVHYQKMIRHGSTEDMNALKEIVENQEESINRMSNTFRREYKKLEHAEELESRKAKFYHGLYGQMGEQVMELSSGFRSSRQTERDMLTDIISLKGDVGASNYIELHDERRIS